MDKCLDLFFQALPNTRTFRLENQTLRSISAVDQLEDATLQTVKCIFQRKINHGAWFYFSIPDRITLRDLQTHPQGQPAFACLAWASKQCKTGWEQAGDNPLYGWKRRGEQFFCGDCLWKFGKSHLHHPFLFGIHLLSHTIVFLCVVSFTL